MLTPFPGAAVLSRIASFVVSFALISVMFAAICKVLPDKPLGWREVGVGAVATALLFTVGKVLIGLYIGTSTVASSYGAAGTALVLLLWIHYSAEIFLLGAESTKVMPGTTAARRHRPRRARSNPSRGEPLRPLQDRLSPGPCRADRSGRWTWSPSARSPSRSCAGGSGRDWLAVPFPSRRAACSGYQRGPGRVRDHEPGQAACSLVGKGVVGSHDRERGRDPRRLRRAGGLCRTLGSPFTARLLEVAARALDRSTELGCRILDWPGEPGAEGDNLPLRLAGGLHALVRQERLPELARLYPPHPLPDQETMLRAVAKALAEAGDEIAPWLDSAPQTNEALRAATIMAGLLVIAQRTGLPLSLYELGASAGLNLVLDRYEHRLGPDADKAAWVGTRGSPVVLAPAWEGAPPPAAEVRITRRRGMDLAPLDPADPADRERLLAYVWADQAERLARTEAALDLAASDPPVIDQADAAAWTETHLALAPEPGVARVLTHAIAFQYFPDETKRLITAHAEHVGAQATDAAPFAWLRLEMEPESRNEPVLRLRLWPGGEDEQLAMGHLHGDSVRWDAGKDERG